MLIASLITWCNYNQLFNISKTNELLVGYCCRDRVNFLLWVHIWPIKLILIIHKEALKLHIDASPTSSTWQRRKPAAHQSQINTAPSSISNVVARFHDLSFKMGSVTDSGSNQMWNLNRHLRSRIMVLNNGQESGFRTTLWCHSVADIWPFEICNFITSSFYPIRYLHDILM